MTIGISLDDYPGHFVQQTALLVEFEIVPDCSTQSTIISTEASYVFEATNWNFVRTIDISSSFSYTTHGVINAYNGYCGGLEKTLLVSAPIQDYLSLASADT